MEEDFRDGWVILRLAGELDLRGAQVLRRRAETALYRHGTWRLVLNLKKVGFLDSSGLGALLARHRALTLRGGALVLVAPQPHVRAVLQLSGLAGILPVAPTEERALAQAPAAPRPPEPWRLPEGLGGA